MDSRPQRPRVYDYIDVLSYLQSYYKFRKSNDKGFSYEAWAGELGLNSRSFLRMMVSGKKNLSQKFVEAFAHLNFSTKNEDTYFTYMVKYSQSYSAKDRQQYSQKMLELLKHEHGAQIVSENADLVSEPLLPRLLSLLCFSDLRATVAKCARILKLEPAKIEEALHKLRSMKLVEEVEADGQKVWLALSDVFHVPDNYGSFNLIKFHEKSLSDALLAFHQPKELRRYKSLFVPLDEKNLEKFNTALEDFISEQLLIHNSKNCRGRYLYQVNFNFHPFTQRMDDELLDESGGPSN